MIELGKYAFTVIASYAATFIVLALLVGVTWVQARRARQRLAEAEARQREEGRHG